MEFTHLGRTAAYKNSDWATLYQNIWKARRRWVIVGKAEMKTGEMVREQGML